MSMKKMLFGIVLGLGLGSTVPVGAATLVGDNVGCQITGGGTFSCTPSTANVVDGTAEFAIEGPDFTFFTLDLGPSSLTLTNLLEGTLQSTIITLTDLDFSPSASIVGIANFVTNATAGVSESDVTFTADSLVFDLRGSSWGGGAQVARFDFVTRELPPVPVPAALPLLASGLGALGVIGWRRKRKLAQAHA